MPIHTYIKGNSGPRGGGQVTVLPHSVVVKMDSDGRTFEFSRENAPADIRSGHFAVSISNDESKLYGILVPGVQTVNSKGKTLWSTRYAVFDGLYKKTDEPFTTKSTAGGYRSSKDKKRHWYDPDSETFTARFKLLGGGPEVEGMIAPMTLRYLFTRYEDTNEAWIVGKGDFAKWATQLEDTLRCCGADFTVDSVPYSADPSTTLEWIDTTLRERNKLVQVVIGEIGFVNKVLPAGEGVTIDQFEKPTKSAKPRAAKANGKAKASRSKK